MTTDQLRAERDEAREMVFIRMDPAITNKNANNRLDALLLAERRLALAEAAEKMDRKANESDGRAIRLTAHMGYSHSAAFLRQLSENAE